MPAMRGDRSEGTGEEAVGEMPAAVESSDSEESFEAPSESAIASPQASEMTYTELDRYGHGDESEETLEQPSVIETSTPPPAEEAASPADSQSPPAPVEEPLESDEEVSFDLSMLSPPAEEEGPAVDAPTFEPSSAEGGEGQPAEVVLDSSSSETKEGQSEEPSFEPSSAEAGEEHAEESVFEPSSTERKEEQSDEVAFEPPSPEVEDESVDAPTFELPPIDLEDDETDTPPFAPVDDAADGSDEPLFESSPIETEDESVDAPTFELPLLETEDDDSEEPIFEPSPTESVDGTVRPVDEGDEGATPRRTEVSTTTDKEQEEELFFDRPTSEESFPMEEETLVMDMETDDDETGDDSDTSRNRPVNISPTDSEFTSDETQVFDRGSLSRLRSEMQTDPVYASPPRQEPSSESGDVDRSSESDDDEEILFDVAPKLEGASSTKPAGSRQTDEPARQAGDDTKAKDESLITGDDIMKQMDSFFGI
jgi:hypothetical protein